MNLPDKLSVSHTDAAIASEKSAAVTPAMQQYLSIKAKHTDCMLFYRMGDFYELFFDDAEKASGILDIALTKRGKHAGNDIPMCGVPAHSYEPYLERLIKSGQRVAICEQLEEPGDAKKRGYKAIIRREVVRIVTPGTLTEDSLLDAKSANYLACVARTSADQVSLAWLDLSTGEFQVTDSTEYELNAELARISPKEILVSAEVAPLVKDWSAFLSVQPDNLFDSRRGERLLREAYSIASLDAFGNLNPSDIAACGALLDYVRLTQQCLPPQLAIPKREEAAGHMLIDAATQRNLELTRRLSGERSGSLLSSIDRTLTSPGARLLSNWLGAPLTDTNAIGARQDAIAFLLEKSTLRASLRDALKSCPDIERSISRLCMERGGPRDMLAIKAGLETARTIGGFLEMQNRQTVPPLLRSLHDELRGHDTLIDRIHAAIRPEAGVFARDGNFIHDGFSAPLDEFRALRDESKRLIAALQQRYAEETGITSLKIRFNNVLGYYIEITPAHQHKVSVDFIHRQTMAGALRYSTVELSDLERKIGEAAERALKLELELFESLLKSILTDRPRITASARALAALDVLAALAELAEREEYVRPIVDNSVEFSVHGGRHPVVEQSLKKSGTPFIGNDCQLSHDSRVWLLTGPNMAGKSTFLRQNALIAILAHIGSYVPAESARIGIIDRLFSRVGAADDLARGQSTFMVEMVETAAILNQASPRSFVILDEIGRGTATYDGLSIAWAVVEHLHNTVSARALFATHYHELNLLAQELPALSCHTMRVREWKGSLVFLHEVAAGVADRSYGIHVAKLAGLPSPVISRAEQVLRALERERDHAPLAAQAKHLPLFDMAAPAPAAEHPALERLRTLNPDSLTPKAALDEIYSLKTLFE